MMVMRKEVNYLVGKSKRKVVPALS